MPAAMGSALMRPTAHLRPMCPFIRPVVPSPHSVAQPVKVTSVPQSTSSIPSLISSIDPNLALAPTLNTAPSHKPIPSLAPALVVFKKYVKNHVWHKNKNKRSLMSQCQ
jgi:hypothetical protein